MKTIEALNSIIQEDGSFDIYRLSKRYRVAYLENIGFIGGIDQFIKDKFGSTYLFLFLLEEFDECQKSFERTGEEEYFSEQYCVDDENPLFNIDRFLKIIKIVEEKPHLKNKIESSFIWKKLKELVKKIEFGDPAKITFYSFDETGKLHESTGSYGKLTITGACKEDLRAFNISYMDHRDEFLQAVKEGVKVQLGL